MAQISAFMPDARPSRTHPEAAIRVLRDAIDIVIHMKGAPLDECGVIPSHAMLLVGYRQKVGLLIIIDSTYRFGFCAKRMFVARRIDELETLLFGDLQLSDSHQLITQPKRTSTVLHD